MFRNKSKNKNNYGTFRSPVKAQFKFLRNRTANLVGAVLLCSGLVVGIGFLLFQNEEKKLTFIPEALASEMPGWWYRDYFGSSVCNEERCKPGSDPDQDKLTNAQEFYFHTHPLKKDTNNNGFSDGEDVSYNYDPSQPGKVTFDDIASDDNIFGEGLLFNEDIKKVLNEEANPINVPIPEIKDVEINITTEVTEQSIKKYSEEIANAMSSYLPRNVEVFVAETIESADSERVEDLKQRLAKTYFDLLKVKVPQPFAQLHKYNIAMLKLLVVVVDVPSSEKLTSVTDPQANLWYDHVQALFQVYQKIDLETRRLNQTK